MPRITKKDIRCCAFIQGDKKQKRLCKKYVTDTFDDGLMYCPIHIKSIRDERMVKADHKTKPLSNHECPICYETIDDITNQTTLTCNHLFHTQCIQHWVNKTQSNSSCPVCRKVIFKLPYEPNSPEEYIHQQTKSFLKLGITCYGMHQVVRNAVDKLNSEKCHSLLEAKQLVKKETQNIFAEIHKLSLPNI